MSTFRVSYGCLCPYYLVSLSLQDWLTLLFQLQDKSCVIELIDNWQHIYCSRSCSSFTQSLQMLKLLWRYNREHLHFFHYKKAHVRDLTGKNPGDFYLGANNFWGRKVCQREWDDKLTIDDNCCCQRKERKGLVGGNLIFWYSPYPWNVAWCQRPTNRSQHMWQIGLGIF